jgi:hypothetical protein
LSSGFSGVSSCFCSVPSFFASSSIGPAPCGSL